MEFYFTKGLHLQGISRMKHSWIHKKWIITVLIVAIIIRIGWVMCSYQTLGMEGFFETDTKSYTRVADSLVNGYGYKTRLPEGQYYYEVSRTPGYPLIIALWKVLLGKNWEWPLLSLQIVLDSLIAMLIIHLFCLHGYPKAGLIGGLYYALNPTAFFSVASFMTESICTFFLFLGVYFFYRIVWAEEKRPVLDSERDATKQWLFAFLTGISWGYATLVRPVVYYPLLACFVIFIIFLVYNKLILHKRDIQLLPKKNINAVLLIIPFILFIGISGSWIARNGLVSNYWSISAIDYVNLMFYRAAAVEAEQQNVGVDDISGQYIKKYGLERKRDYSAEGLQRGKELKKEAARIIKSDPLSYIKVAFRGAMRLMFGDHETYISFFIGDRFAPNISMLYSVIMLGVWGVAFYGVYRYPRLIPVALLTFFIIGVSSGWESYARFRVPIEPYIGMAFGFGFSSLLLKEKHSV